MKKTIKGKTYNTDKAVELEVSVKNVEVNNGIKTLVFDRVYESNTGNDRFVVTTSTMFKTNNSYDYLTGDDMFIGCKRTLSPLKTEEIGTHNIVTPIS